MASNAGGTTVQTPGKGVGKPGEEETTLTEDNAVAWKELKRYKVSELKDLCTERKLTFDAAEKRKQPLIDVLKQYHAEHVKGKEKEGSDEDDEEDDENGSSDNETSSSDDEAVIANKENVAPNQQSRESSLALNRISPSPREHSPKGKSFRTSKSTKETEKICKQLKKIDKFDGTLPKREVRNWVNMVQIVLDGCKFDQEQVIRALALRFRGKVVTWWTSLTNKPAKINDLLSLIEDSYGQDRNVLDEQEAFEKIRQNKKQTIVDWSTTVRSAAKTAGYKPNGKEAASQFVRGLYKSRVQSKAADAYSKSPKFDKCLEAAVAAAKKYRGKHDSSSSSDEEDSSDDDRKLRKKKKKL